MDLKWEGKKRDKTNVDQSERFLKKKMAGRKRKESSRGLTTMFAGSERPLGDGLESETLLWVEEG